MFTFLLKLLKIGTNGTLKLFLNRREGKGYKQVLIIKNQHSYRHCE